MCTHVDFSSIFAKTDCKYSTFFSPRLLCPTFLSLFFVKKPPFSADNFDTFKKRGSVQMVVTFLAFLWGFSIFIKKMTFFSP